MQLFLVEQGLRGIKSGMLRMNGSDYVGNSSTNKIVSGICKNALKVGRYTFTILSETVMHSLHTNIATAWHNVERDRTTASLQPYDSIAIARQ